MANGPESKSRSVSEAVDPQLHGSDPATWVDRYGDVLFRYAVGRVRDRAVAEELVQDTFLAALRGRTGFAGYSAEQTWLVAILRRRIVDYFRSTAHPASAVETDVGEGLVERYFDRKGHWKQTLPRWPHDADAAFQQQEFWNVLNACLWKLPEAMRSVFCLREMERLDTVAICKLLDMTSSNLWTTLHRARLLLRECLEHNWFAPRSGQREK